MKNLVLGLALVGCIVACKSEKNASIADPAKANMPKAECCTEHKGECTDAEKADCAAKKADCQKTCPMAGKTQS